MMLKILLITILVLNGITAFAFSSFHLNRQKITPLALSSLLMALFAGALFAAGWFISKAITEGIDGFTPQTGLVIFLLVGVRLIIKGWRTKPTERAFDISKTMTYVGLLFISNIDMLLIGLGAFLVFSGTWLTFSLLIAGTSLAGIILGGLRLFRTGVLFQNKVELMSGLGFILAVIASFLFL